MQQSGQNKTPYLLVFIALILTGVSYSLFSSGKYVWALTPAVVSVLSVSIFFLQSLAISKVRGTLSFLSILLAVGSSFLLLKGNCVWAVTPAVVSVILFILSVRNTKLVNLND